jgi:2-methylisocitrate lyase-like PEP mutase family enzyme
MSVSQADKAARFRALHEGPGAFVIANPWDAGSARLLAALGFQALATSSGASAGTLGRRDGQVPRDEALAHARLIVEASDLPVSADLEKCFGDAPDVAAQTIRLAASTGLCGGSIEDATGDPARPLYDLGHATERVAAAAAAARAVRRSVHADGARRELPARQPEPQRHDHAPAGLRESRRRRPDGPRPPGSRGGPRRLRRGLEAGQLHGRHQGQVVHGRRAG